MKGLKWLNRAALPALAAALVLGAAAGSSSSYFTTYVTAQGGHTLQLHDVYIIPHEHVDANVKDITVENVGETECWVRARAIAPEGLELRGVEIAYSGEGWRFNETDGWWYYAEPIQPGASTPTLKASITLPQKDDLNPIPEGAELNVVVVTECTKVLYDDNGAPYADWALMAKEG